MRGLWAVCLLLAATGAWPADGPLPAAVAPAAPQARGWIGVLLGDSVDGGVGIAALVPGGPAARAGLRSGDVIVAANGRPAPSQQALGAVMGELRPGDRLDLAVLRGGRTVRIPVVLGQRNERLLLAPEPPSGPAPPSPSPAPVAAGRRAAGWGLEVAEVTPALRRHYGAPEDSGVLVIRIDPDAPADRAGLAVGDIVFELGGLEVRSVAEVEAGMMRQRGDDPLRARLVRGGEVRELVLPVVAPALLGPDPRAAAPAPGADRERERLKRALAAELAALERRVGELRRRLQELEAPR